MSAEAIGWVFRNSTYHGDGFAVHLAIADVVNDTYHNEFWMSVPALAKKANCSARTVQYTLRLMVANHHLELLAEAEYHKARRYRLLMGANLAPLEDEGVQDTTARGADPAQRGADPAPPYKEELKRTQENSSDKASQETRKQSQVKIRELRESRFAQSEGVT